ncbi:hypothetical protein POVWA1_060200 [Plasmodium ovale wallikeri]|uniref:Uncharacterized protein n=1 Tax=Plasmodium ovale wallikeri TaxID=864142 RepID=A0A1A9A0T9_PLAOA|nr:hypothetical protein POVWA1_060200 [Plasmodium ovale wallikeri]
MCMRALLGEIYETVTRGKTTQGTIFGIFAMFTKLRSCNLLMRCEAVRCDEMRIPGGEGLPAQASRFAQR